MNEEGAIAEVERLGRKRNIPSAAAWIVPLLLIAAALGLTVLGEGLVPTDLHRGNVAFFGTLAALVLTVALALWHVERFGARGCCLACLDALVFVVLLFMLAGTLLGAMMRTSSYRAHCANNLQQIGAALRQYHDHYGSFPPAYVADASGKPLYSWRVLILPFLDRPDLSSRLRADAAWDSPANKDLWTVIRLFSCPSNGRHDPPEWTSYVAAVGPHTAWPGDRGSKLSEFPDGPENTILLVEMAGSGIAWAEPRDLYVGQMVAQFNPAASEGPSSRHAPRGVHVLMADGSVRFLRGDLPPEVIWALLSRDGGEKVDPKDYEHVFPPDHS